MEYDAIIIGGGPGGLTAGLYLARAGRKTALFEQGLLGGQIATAAHVENYPGFPQGASGKELIAIFEEQVQRFGLEIQFGRAESIKDEGEWKEVIVSGFPFRARVVIIATGLLQKLGIPGEEEYLGQGVSYCATCDGALFRQRPVAVTGSSDWAIEEALFLARFADPVYVCTPSSGIKPSNDHRKELLEKENVKIISGVKPVEVTGDTKGVTGIVLEKREGGDRTTLDVDGVFVMSGKKRPGTEFLDGLIELQEDGYAKVDNNCETSVAGIFAVGDVRRKRFHQVATAVGDGAVAGMDAIKYLKEHKG